MAPSEVRDDVYISDGVDARKFGDEYDIVITLSRDDGPLERYGSHEHTTQHFPLYDGPQTEQEDFDKAVGATIAAIQFEDESVLVHCQAGVSRSATVLITALAWVDGTSFETAYDEVWAARPSIAPHPELRKLAKNFLGEDGSVYKNAF